MARTEEGGAGKGCTGRHGKRGQHAPDLALPVIQNHAAHAPGSPPIRKSRNSRLRAGVLTAVNVAIAAHIVQWLLVRDSGGKTLSPVEPSESMYTLELGELNAGFIFFAAALLATIVFGRFVCGWGCHVVALQDFCGWIMKKLGVRPRPFRSRLLIWAPLVLALYMFVWPNFKRLLLLPALDAVWPAALAWFKPVPEWNGFSDHLMVTDLWATFPPIAVAVPFFLVVGFGAVYFLGAKGFCTYGCPYGGFFGVADKLAAGQILADLDACEGCGHCTSTCTSNVRVHEEIQAYGKVVSPGCMKCLDCVSVCPNDALRFGFAAPQAFSRKPAPAARPRPRYDLTVKEEIGLGLLFFFSFLGFRGAYGITPMLMAIGMSGCLVFITWKILRMLNEPNLRFHRFQLTRDRSIRPAGAVFASLGVLLLLFSLHTGLVRFHLWRAESLYSQVTVSPEAIFAGEAESVPPAMRAAADEALYRFQMASSIGEGGIGLLPTRGLGTRKAWLHLVRGEAGAARALVEEELAREGPSDRRCSDLVRIMILQGRLDDAIGFSTELLKRYPEYHEVRDQQARAHMAAGETEEAAGVYLRWLEEHPGDALARARLAAAVYMPALQFEDAVAELRRAAADAPDTAIIRHDLGLALWAAGDQAGAREQLERAVELAPGNATIAAVLAALKARMSEE